MRISSTEGADLLNLQYGVCFGVIFSLFFDIPEKGSFRDIRITIMPIEGTHFIIFFGMLFYFFLDWATLNFLKDIVKFSLTRTVVLSIFVWFLGSIVITVSTSSEARFLLFVLYALPAGFYHLTNYATGWYKVQNASGGGSLLVGILFSVAWILLSLWLSVVLLSAHHRPTLMDSMHELSSYSVFGLLLLKFLHVANLRNLSLQSTNAGGSP